LFLWNSRPDSGRRAIRSALTCFNPCFCGTRARTPPNRSKIISILCFNPCFCGTRARTLTWESRSARHSCFNPCFCGTRARTPTEIAGYTETVLFQSLFLWNSRPDCLLMWLLERTY